MRKLIRDRLHAGRLVTAAAADAAYPSRPITMIVPFGAGGPTDALARIMAQRMSQSLGQPVLIENVTGASGTLGVGRVARAAPDGYTLVIGNWASHVVNSAIFKTPFDYVADFEPVARLSGNPYIIVGKNDAAGKTLPELIAWLKANPDKATEGTGGAGSGQHVGGVYFQKVTGTSFKFVPYKAGSSDVMRDVVAGHIDLSSIRRSRRCPISARDSCAPSRSPTASGSPRRPISRRWTRPARPASMSIAWFGMWMPKGTPKDVIAKFSAAAHGGPGRSGRARAARRSRAGHSAARAANRRGAGHASTRPRSTKWWPIIKEAGIKVE